MTDDFSGRGSRELICILEKSGPCSGTLEYDKCIVSWTEGCLFRIGPPEAIEHVSEIQVDNLGFQNYKNVMVT